MSRQLLVCFHVTITCLGNSTAMLGVHCERISCDDDTSLYSKENTVLRNPLLHSLKDHHEQVFFFCVWEKIFNRTVMTRYISVPACSLKHLFHRAMRLFTPSQQWSGLNCQRQRRTSRLQQKNLQCTSSVVELSIRRVQVKLYHIWGNASFPLDQYVT